MQYSMFLVDDVPYCVWEWDLTKRNLEFLDQIDHDYFRYIAEIHLPHISGENAQRSAIVLRTNYHHALETFFTLLFASFQAPDCVVAYVQRILPSQLRNMIRKVNVGPDQIFNKQKVKSISWEVISDIVNIFSYEDQDRIKDTKYLYSVLWRKFGHEYLNESNTKEYNSIKHGFRIKPGGFFLSVGKEHEYGIPPPSEEMVMVGGSKFGTSFFVAEPVPGVKDKEYEANIRVRRHGLNWDPENMAHALVMLSLSINNVISYLKIVNGVDARTVPFVRPKEPDFFEEPFKRGVGVTNIAIDRVISAEHIKPFSKKEIRKTLAS